MTSKLTEATLQDTASTVAQQQNIRWTTPAPLLADTQATAPYPIWALPTTIQDAITNYQQYGQQPIPLIACSALANISLACQALANVARDRLLISPVSLYFLCVAQSGERKSAADYTFGKAIRQWQEDTCKALLPEVRAGRAMHQAWQVEKNGLLAQIKRSAALGEATESLYRNLIILESNEPQTPLMPVLFYEDTTQEALASQIAEGWPCASLWSDEGGIVMGGYGMQNNSTKFIALLNRLWDGKSFIAHRKTSENFTVANRRLTISLMMQPLILVHMLAKSGGIARQSGFLARSLIAYPSSEMGNRFYKEPPKELPAFTEFYQRLTDCLDESTELDKHGCHNLPTLNLSASAKKAWVSFFNEVESGLTSSGLWMQIRDFASKAAENVVRLAALFHLFDGKSGKISSENTEQAIEIIRWHMQETKKILNHDNPIHQQSDAIKLASWLKEKELTETTPRYVQQFGPLRDKKRRDQAMELLVDTRNIRMLKREGKTVLLVNPNIK